MAEDTTDKIEEIQNPEIAAPAKLRKKVSFIGRERGRFGRKGGRHSERPKQEFNQAIIAIRRVTRVMAGGKRFNFSVAIILGDRKGRVGVGLGKAADTSRAIEKASREAKKLMIRIPLTPDNSLSREISAKYSSAQVLIRPSPGRGLAAGSAARTVLDLAGVNHVNAKILSRSKNKLNIARATLEALKKLI